MKMYVLSIVVASMILGTILSIIIGEYELKQKYKRWDLVQNKEDKREVKLLALDIIQEIAVGNDIEIIKKNIEKILLLSTDYIDFTVVDDDIEDTDREQSFF
jgi:hypothetical protein